MFLGLDLRDGSHLAIKDMAGNELTYGQLVGCMTAFKECLSERSLAFCMCKNTVGCAIGYLSMVDAGIVPVMLSERMDQELLHRLAEIYAPEYWWSSEDFSYVEGPALYSSYGYKLTRGSGDPCEMYEELQLCMTTSGSTGDPKLVRYKKGNLETNALNVARAFGWSPEERGFCDLGLQYTMGLNVFNSHLISGATALLCDANVLSAEYWDYLKDVRATNITGVPFTYDIYARLHFMQMDLPYLTTLAEGGGKLTDKRFIEFATFAAENGKRFFATFGTTETSARLSYLPPELALEKVGSIGKPIPGGKMFLIDSDGCVIEGCPAEGELCYSGPNVTMGYARQRNDLALGDEWQGTYRTGDLARRDEDGYYFITGRLSRFLKLLGHRVSLDQCERLLHEKLGLSCACVGTDERMTVYVEGDCDVVDVVNTLSSALNLRRSLFEAKQIDLIPRNETGKIIYATLG